VANVDGKKQTKPKVEKEKIIEPPQNAATQGHFSPV